MYGAARRPGAEAARQAPPTAERAIHISSSTTACHPTTPQARSTCAERGAALELLRAEYARLLAVLQGPARRGGLMDSLRRELRREQARTNRAGKVVALKRGSSLNH